MLLSKGLYFSKKKNYKRKAWVNPAMLGIWDFGAPMVPWVNNPHSIPPFFLKKKKNLIQMFFFFLKGCVTILCVCVLKRLEMPSINFFYHDNVLISIRALFPRKVFLFSIVLYPIKMAQTISRNVTVIFYGHIYTLRAKGLWFKKK